MEKQEKQIIAPMSGELLPLEAVPDSTFSDKSLGDGFALKLSGDVVVSPFNGIVIAAFPTGHAFIIRRDDGLEALIHIGLDSAKNTAAFKAKINKYAHVKQGDILTYVDKNQFSANENALISPVVFSNPNIKVTLNKMNQAVLVGDESAVSIELL
ncbi:NagE protein [Chelonobacter oris]|uniref:PTS sugar transporter subunit IIA n=1 Tax=Chelonobacter oris TaxID=505317 RepID=UPI00244B6349|nr:glucose PTS transporter subunit IIA [Chelonobacter oris]MDH3001254.1 NagE protein [Chelonobacter oris]